MNKYNEIIGLNNCFQSAYDMSDFYQNNFMEYHQKTFYADMSSILMPLVRKLAPKTDVLDVGCGSGRDLLWLKKKNFNVIGFERSLGLAELAGKNAGCEIHLGNNPDNGESFQATVKKRCWFGATVDISDSYSLVGCTVAPGFDFQDFEMETRNLLIDKYPAYNEIIERLTK